MRLVVFGAGAVGCVIGGRVHQHRDRHGVEVTLVARGPHLDALRRDGLVLNDPHGSVTLDVPAVGAIGDVALADGDIVVLAMKTQDTEAALADLRDHAPAGVVVACAQNGVTNERLALRRFDQVIGICVVLPATFLEPGVVDASGTPHNAILDLGAYPGGTTEASDALAALFETSGLPSRSLPDVMAWKYRKLLMNLGNAFDALVADRENGADIIGPVRAEAKAVYAAAGIDAVTSEQDKARRAGVMEIAPIPGRAREGGSTWQGMARGATSSEVDWLNGEIVLLGRLHGVPTPVNAMLCREMRRAVVERRAPRSMTTAELLARV